MAMRMLTEPEGYGLLAKAGVPVPPHRVARDARGAVEAAERVGYPVVLKVLSEQVVHKSDAGGVVMGVSDAKGVEAAFASINESVARKVKGARVDGVVVERMMPKGLELLIGGRTDPSFGKVLTFGMGGTLVELVADVAIRVLPADEAELRRMVHQVRGYALVRGYRGEPPRDERALMDAIRAVARLFLEDPRVVEFDINPLLLYGRGACAVDARVYVDDALAAARPPPARDRAKEREAVRAGKALAREAFRPRSVAVVGASADPGKVGYAVLRNMLAFGGEVYPVNPKHDEVLGRRCYPTLDALPGKVDMAVVTVPAAAVPDVLAQAARRGVRLSVVISAGFREEGEEGAELERRALEAIAGSGMRVVGPNCLGVMLPHQGINATFDPATPRPGRLAFVSQSGATITTMVDWSLLEGVGFSAIVSVGNQADLGFVDYLRFASEDKDTSTIVLYIEQVKDGAEFMRVARDVARRKHIVAIKAGSSKRGQKAASSHTGSLAGSHEVYMAAFRQAGIVIAHSLTEAFHAAELLASEDYPKGRRTVVVTNAGGFGVLASDYAERYGLEMVELPAPVVAQLGKFLPGEWSHENPMDIIGDAGPERYARVFDAMERHQDLWDIAVVIAVPSATMDPRRLAQEIIQFSRATDKMVVGCLLGGQSMRGGVSVLREGGIRNFEELEEAFDALGKSVEVLRE